MAEFIGTLTANTGTQFFSVIITTASIRCLVENFQLVWCSQQVNTTWQYDDSGSSNFSKWPNDRMVAVVNNCWPLCKEEEAAEKNDQRLLLDRR